MKACLSFFNNLQGTPNVGAGWQQRPDAARATAMARSRAWPCAIQIRVWRLGQGGFVRLLLTQQTDLRSLGTEGS